VKQLNDLVSEETSRQQVIQDCVSLVDDEVRSKKGLGGVAVKAAYAVVKAIHPRIITESINSLLDDFIAQLQAFYARYQEEGASETLERYLQSRSGEVAEALLSITDKRAQRASNKTMVKAYNKLRPKGKVHVEAATPGIGRVLDKHVGRL
jgi:hypothetical protein